MQARQAAVRVRSPDGARWAAIPRSGHRRRPPRGWVADRIERRHEAFHDDPEKYQLREKVERWFNKLKQFRRIATRYDKLSRTFLAFVHLAATRFAFWNSPAVKVVRTVPGRAGNDGGACPDPSVDFRHVRCRRGAIECCCACQRRRSCQHQGGQGFPLLLRPCRVGSPTAGCSPSRCVSRWRCSRICYCTPRLRSRRSEGQTHCSSIAIVYKEAILEHVAPDKDNEFVES